MIKTILLVENEFNRQYRIKQLIQESLEYTRVYVAEDMALAYKILLEKTIDIFIVNAALDSESTTDTSGMRFVAKIREIPKYTLAPVILLSSLLDESMYAYEELHCLGYLPQNFSAEKMQRLLQQASYFQTSRQAEAVLFLRKNRVLYPIKIKDVVYIIRMEGALYIHFADGKVLDIPYVTFRAIEEDVENGALLMCNRYTMVNREYVYAIDPGNHSVILRDDRGVLELGDKYRRRMLLEFTNFNAAYPKKVNTKKIVINDET